MNTIQTKEQINLTSWDDHMNSKYGELGTNMREEWEQTFEAFKLGVLQDDVRNKIKC